jgi:hypothetical protein
MSAQSAIDKCSTCIYSAKTLGHMGNVSKNLVHKDIVDRQLRMDAVHILKETLVKRSGKVLLLDGLCPLFLMKEVMGYSGILIEIGTCPCYEKVPRRKGKRLKKSKFKR